ncbi:MAG: peptidoglycan-binding domain-containing protein [Mycobacteriales bacterium]
MTAQELKGPFIQAKGYSRGKGQVNWLVLHTAQGSRTVQSLGNYFAGTKAGSSNGGVDEDEYAAYVTYNNTAWTNPPINTQSDTLELCGFAAWTRAEWLTEHPGMLEMAARWIAWRASVRGIPIRLITGADAANGKSGILDHKRVNDAFGKSNHTDVGPGFPWDVVISRAQEIALPPQPKQAGDRLLGIANPPMRGQDVANVQNALRFVGNDITVDGVYGRQTADLITLFQDRRHIAERGVGPLTWAALRKAVHG